MNGSGRPEASRPPGADGPPAPSGSAPTDEFSPEDQVLIDDIAALVVRRRMTVPAILFIESSRPLSFIGSQFLYFLQPIVGGLIRADQYARFARLLEERDNVERLLRAIESADADYEARVRAERAADREAKKLAAGEPTGWRGWLHRGAMRLRLKREEREP